MRYLMALTMLMGFGAVPSSATAKNACSIDMYERADASLLSAAGSWGSLLQHQKAFASCDDGALAEGYSDAVASLLARRWDKFDLFLVLSKRNPAFRRWAVRHIDATASDDDLNKIVLNASACIDDVKAKSLCRTIQQAAVDALTEQKQLLHK
jgi:hypothetical protein